LPQLAFGYVAAPIPHLVPFKMLHLIDGLTGFGFLANLGHRSFVPMFRMEAIIYVPPEVFVPMKPGAGPNEDSAGKPLRAIVTVRSARIRRSVIVTVRALRGDPDADGHLSIRFGSRHGQEQSSHGRQSEIFQ